MFWKKKSKQPVLLSIDDNERRRDVRIKPLKPLFLNLAEQAFPILDISASGLSFDNQTNEPGQEADIRIELPHPSDEGTADRPKTIIQCRLNILKCTGTICHCQFRGLSQEAQKQLDHFILNEQKQQIRLCK